MKTTSTSNKTPSPIKNAGFAYWGTSFGSRKAAYPKARNARLPKKVKNPTTEIPVG
jgi:hypothetical protein